MQNAKWSDVSKPDTDKRTVRDLWVVERFNGSTAYESQAVAEAEAKFHSSTVTRYIEHSHYEHLQKILDQFDVFALKKREKYEKSLQDRITELEAEVEEWKDISTMTDQQKRERGII